MEKIEKLKHTERNSALELLRIITMVMIVFHHFAVHGCINFQSTDLCFQRYWFNFIAMGGKIGVNIFVLISGYFLVTDNEPLFNFKKILKFWGQVFFYSITIWGVTSYINKTPIEIKSLLKALCPITYNSWWFATAYFIMYILHPFLNILLQRMKKEALQSLILVLLFCFCLIPTITMEKFYGNEVIWFLTLYCIAGYIRLYGLKDTQSRSSGHYFMLWGIFSVLTYLSSVAIMHYGTTHEKYAIYPYVCVFFSMEKLPGLLISVSLFMAFLKLNIPYKKWINIIASGTFGVYLLHDSALLRRKIWVDTFGTYKYGTSNMFIPYSIGVVLLVFAVGIVIDLLRKLIFERAFMAFINSYGTQIAKPFVKLTNRIKKRIFH